MYYCYHSSPVGSLLLAGDGDGLRLIAFEQERHPVSPEPGWIEDPTPLRRTMTYLDAYFNGKKPKVRVPAVLTGTPFQLAVWSVLQDIPYGETCSYGEVARQVGKPAAARAVGAAVGQNPIPILIPCHRVVGASGALTGFGGGLGVKRTLLALEASHA